MAGVNTRPNEMPGGLGGEISAKGEQPTRIAAKLIEISLFRCDWTQTPLGGGCGTRPSCYQDLRRVGRDIGRGSGWRLLAPVPSCSSSGLHLSRSYRRPAPAPSSRTRIDNPHTATPQGEQKEGRPAERGKEMERRSPTLADLNASDVRHLKRNSEARRLGAGHASQELPRGGCTLGLEARGAARP